MNKARKIITLLLANIGVLIVLLGLLEIVLRVWGRGYNNAPVDSDPVLDWVHPNDYAYTSYGPSGEFGNFTVYFDSLGRRSQLPQKASPRPPGSQTIAFIGDSFVEALQVPYDSSFTGRLAARYPGISFVNYGVTGYAPVLYYLQCRRMLTEHHLRPQQVVMVLYSNDVREDSAFLSRAVYASNGEIAAINGGRKNSLQALLRRSYVVRLVRKAVIRWQYARRAKDTRTVDGTVVNDLLEEASRLEHTLTEQYILKTDSLLKKNGVAFYVTAIPSRYIHFTRDTTFRSFAKISREWAVGHGLKYIDLQQAFDRATFMRHEKFFFNIDVHCNARGHGVIADALDRGLFR